MTDITISDSLIILATFLGPIVAIQVQKFIEKLKEGKNRKLWLFHTLMATRANRVSDRHVEALNMIEIEYHNDKKAKKIIDAWREYHSLLNDRGMDIKQWTQKQNELFVNLLYEMSQFLGYSYNRVEIQKGCYSPEAHGEREAIQTIISRGFADIFIGKKTFPISLSNSQDGNQEVDKKDNIDL
ncbi:MAG: DUF6680 family protein [Rickettsiales bacterium]|nr:DUF6680 family protein [Rickettsiales bacterium]